MDNNKTTEPNLNDTAPDSGAVDSELSDPTYKQKSQGTQVPKGYELRSGDKKTSTQNPKEQNSQVETIQNINETEEQIPVAIQIENTDKKTITSTTKMAEAKQKQIERYSRMLPVLVEDARSLESFIRKADTLYNLLTDKDDQALFLNCVKDCTSENTFSDIAALTTWEEVKTELKIIILPVKSVSQLHSELTILKKYPWESITVFTDKIKKIANALKNAHTLTDQKAADTAWVKIFEMIETQSLNTFIEGLGPQMKNWVMAKSFKTLKEASTYAKELEHFDREIKKSVVTNKVNEPINAQNPNWRNPATNQQKVCNQCNRKGHTATECYSKTVMPRVNFERTGQNRESFQKPRLQRPLCTYCGKQGHTKDRCYGIRAENCSYCGKAGHILANCLRKIADQPQAKMNFMNYENEQRLPMQPFYPVYAPPQMYKFSGTPQYQMQPNYFGNQMQTKIKQDGRETRNNYFSNPNSHRMNPMAGVNTPQPNFQIAGPAKIQVRDPQIREQNLSGNE